MTMDPDHPIAITLEAQQWNLIIEVLQSAPFRVAAPLIGSIRRQAMAVIGPDMERQSGNGIDEKGTANVGVTS
jgi:hypothetical protein